MADLHPDDMEELRELAALTTGPVKVAAPALAALLSEHDRQREEIGRLRATILKLCDEFEDATYDTNSGGQSIDRKSLIVECRAIALASEA